MIFEAGYMRMPTEEEMYMLMSDPDVHRALAQKATVDAVFERMKKK